MTFLDNLHSIYNKLVNSFNNYNEIIKTNLTKAYEKHSHVENNLKLLNELTNEMVSFKSNDFINSIQDIFKIFNIIGRINDLLENSHKELYIGDDEIQTTRSASFIISFQQKYNIISSEYHKDLDTINKLLSELLHLNIGKLVNEELKDIYKLYMDNPYSLLLFKHYIEHVIEIGKYKYSEIVYYLDKLKDFAIDNSYSKLINKKVEQSNIKLQRFGLIPVHQNVNMEKIMNLIFNIKFEDSNKNKVGGSDDCFYKILNGISNNFNKLDNVAKQNKIGLLCMTLLLEKPIMYNINKIYRKKIASNYITHPRQGASLKLIDKFSTVKNLNAKNLKFYKKIEKMGDLNSNKWCIVRTLDGKHFDLMSTDISKMLLDKYMIDRIVRGGSMRIHKYHCINNIDLDNKIKEPVEIVRETKYELNKIQSVLIMNLFNFVECKIDSSTPKNIEDVYSIISDDIENVTFDTINDSFIEEFESWNKEVYATYIYNVDRISNDIGRMLREGFAKISIDEIIFIEKTERAIVKYLKDLFKDIIDKSVKKVFNPKSDIFFKLLSKKQLLSIEI